MTKVIKDIIFDFIDNEEIESLSRWLKEGFHNCSIKIFV
jgi:hypothetical protein